jgi:hypothetical protein
LKTARDEVHAPMVSHIVLFRPRRDLSSSERDAFVAALDAARHDIASVRRFRIGRRVVHGREYERGMSVDFEFAAIVEFDDLAGLQDYLAHPAHEALGRLFGASLESALVYDYDMAEGEETGALLKKNA